MKKLYTLAAAAVAALALTANAEIRLAQITTDSGFEEYGYQWNEAGQLVRADAVSDLKWYNVFEYDEQGNIIKDSTFQWMDADDDYRNVNYCSYEYNADGKVTVRKNYNSWNPGVFELGGVIIYTYNEDGTMARNDTYWDEALTNHFAYDIYEYADGKVTKITSWMFDYMVFDIIESAITEMQYDDQGRKVGETFRMYDSYGSGDWVEMPSKRFVYDEAGDLIEIAQYNGERKTDSEVLTYHMDVPRADVVYPYTHEELIANELYSMVQHAIDVRTVYATDIDSGELGLFDVYRYTYTGFSGIDSLEADADTLGVTVTDGILVIEGLAGGAQLNICDLAGRTILSGAYRDGGVALGTLLQSGSYVVSTSLGAAKITL